MKPEVILPFAENERARMLLSLLSRGPASTLDLQRDLPLVHVARQVWELRHWYGYEIRTTRLPNRVAVYRLVGKARMSVIPPQSPTCPKCANSLNDIKATLTDGILDGRCRDHGRTLVRVA